mgnify:CR=1 FL=1
MRSAPCLWSRFFAARMAMLWVEDEWTVGREKIRSRLELSQSGQAGSLPPRIKASNWLPQSWQEYS